jgi:hypothetical protein
MSRDFSSGAWARQPNHTREADRVEAERAAPSRLKIIDQIGPRGLARVRTADVVSVCGGPCR